MFFNDENSGGKMVTLMIIRYNGNKYKSLKTTYFPSSSLLTSSSFCAGSSLSGETPHAHGSSIVECLDSHCAVTSL